MTAYDPAVHRTVVAATGEVSKKFHSVNKLLIDMDAAGMIRVLAQDLAPGDTTAVWLDLTIPEDGNGQAKVYDGGAWVPLTPEYFVLHYGASTQAAQNAAAAAASSAVAAGGYKDQSQNNALATAADVITTNAAKGAAQTAQSASETARDNAVAAKDFLASVYLGPQASDPTVDLNGDPLTTGDWYYNTTIHSMRIYDENVGAGEFVTYSPSSGITALVEDTSPKLGGNLDPNGHAITGLGIGTDVQAYSANLDSWSMKVPSDYLTTTAAASAYQPLASTLTSLASASANGVSLVTAADYAAMRGLLDLEAGTDFLSPSAIAAAYQALSNRLTDIAGLAVTDGNIIVGNGTTWVAESGGTARTSLGLGASDSPSFAGVVVGGVPVYPQIPQVVLSANTTLDATHANKHLLHPAADNNARTFTIDSNANLALPVGTVFVFVNEANTLSIAIASDTLTLAYVGSTGTRTLAANGIATALKTGSTKWLISGVGLS